tara:strand:+ start:1514 stop:1621 length:108 start_codon:yes stop_codon:yes gene_type:complete
MTSTASRLQAPKRLIRVGDQSIHNPALLLLLLLIS